jgi:hypothetical protein
VLANAVGPQGHVTAVDLADPSYGTPVSLGDSAKFLSQGPLGDRIDFRFGFDVFDPANAFNADSFDVIVLAHCTWYFDSLQQLTKTLQQIRTWGPRLCLSEWDLEPQSIPQLSHLLAVLIQGQVESYKSGSAANVRTPYSRKTLSEILESTGWTVVQESLVDTSELDDAKWEIGMCLSNSPQEVHELPVPPKVRELLISQIDILRQVAAGNVNKPLPSYSLVAQRT